MRRKIRGSDVEPANLIKHVASKICPVAVPLSTIAEPHVIKTGDAEIDSLLGGGVRSGCITELVGESAAGKSHLTLVLALAAQHPTLSSCPGGAIVISSERVLETNRLVELAKVLRAKHGGPPVKTLLDNIQSSRVADIEALEHALAFVVPPMLEQAREAARPQEGSAVTPAPMPVRLLIIDSLTALLRGETERSSAGLAQRSRHICTVADRLKALATAFDLAVVVVNQVKDVFGPEPGPLAATQAAAAATQAPGTQMPASQFQFPDSQQVALEDVPPPMLYSTQAAHFSGTSPGINKEAALGIVWANAVNTRIMLGRTGRRRMLTVEEVTRGKRPRLGTPSRPSSPALDAADAAAAALHLELDTAKPTLIRRMHLVFSPACSPGMIDYIITPSGIHALAGSFRAVDLGPAIRRRDVRMRLAMAERRAEANGNGDGSSGFKPERSTQLSIPASSQVKDEEDDDVYDDLGELPPEFWEGVEKLDAEPLAVGVVD